MKNTSGILSFALFLLVSPGCYAQKISDTDIKQNILFIAVDDLKPLLNTYGAAQMKTPNMDRLAKEGIQFNKAYCNIPVCGASRASILTGVRPNATRFSGYSSWASKDLPGAISLPRIFKQNGYQTVSIGKISHHPTDYVNDWDILDEDYNNFLYRNPASIKVAKQQKILNGKNPGELARQGPAFEKADVPDNAYSDGQSTNKAIALLKKFRNSNQPFFMAIGYIEPHLPFKAPAKYWDMYKPEDIKLAENPFFPKNAVDGFLHNSPELRNMYTGIPQEGPIPDDLAKKLVHGYYASVSYTDAMIGQLYDALEELGLKENTTIVLWGDHGFFLGQHSMWTKHSTLMEAINVPFIISSPGFNKGIKTSSLVEYVDVYPTLCAIAGINPPKYLDGKSLIPILKKPESKIHSEVFSRYGNQEVVVNERYSYMELVDKNTQKVKGRMLFDHLNDPLENFNIAEMDENKALVAKMSNQLLEMRLHVNEQPDISK